MDMAGWHSGWQADVGVVCTRGAAFIALRSSAGLGIDGCGGDDSESAG